MICDVEFYCRENGNIPGKKFLLSLNPKMSAKVFGDIELLSEHGFDLREPYVKLIKGKKNQGLKENWKEPENIVKIMKEGVWNGSDKHQF